jgi:hypothetical protein
MREASLTELLGQLAFVVFLALLLSGRRSGGVLGERTRPFLRFVRAAAVCLLVFLHIVFCALVEVTASPSQGEMLLPFVGLKARILKPTEQISMPLIFSRSVLARRSNCAERRKYSALGGFAFNEDMPR